MDIPLSILLFPSQFNKYITTILKMLGHLNKHSHTVSGQTFTQSLRKSKHLISFNNKKPLHIELLLIFVKCNSKSLQSTYQKLMYLRNSVFLLLILFLLHFLLLSSTVHYIDLDFDSHLPINCHLQTYMAFSHILLIYFQALKSARIKIQK